MSLDVYDPEKEDVEVKEESPFLTGQEIGVGLKAFFMGSGLGLLFYCLVYFGLMSFFTFYFLWKAIAAISITYLLLIALDKAMGEKPTRTKVPVMVVVFVAFLITCFVGYQGEAKAADKQPAIVMSSETGNLHSVNDIWFTDKCFKVGEKIKIEVLYSDVKMTNFGILTPGVHTKTMAVFGCLMFEGVSNKPTQIKITY